MIEDQAIQRARQECFNKVLAGWQKLKIDLPAYGGELSDTTTQDIPQGKVILGFGQRFRQNSPAPRICDVEIPSEYQSQLKEYGQKTDARGRSCGEKSLLPDSWELHLPAETQDAYNDWWLPIYQEWLDNNKSLVFLGWHAEVILGQRGPSLSFGFSPLGRLRSLFFCPDMATVGKQHTELLFRSNRLFSFDCEVDNGTFFPDPKGPKESRWPKWLVGLPGSKKHFVVNECDWQDYLERVRRKEKVFNPKGQLVYQTERQARWNLANWQNWTYQNTRQVFHFQARTETPPGYRSELGSVTGMFGRYVHHRVLSAEETVQTIEQWNPINLLAV